MPFVPGITVEKAREVTLGVMQPEGVVQETVLENGAQLFKVILLHQSLHQSLHQLLQTNLTKFVRPLGGVIRT